MARGRKSTPEHKVRECFILQPDLRSYSAIGRRLDLAPNTVKSILNNKEYIAKYSNLLQEIEDINEKSNKTIIAIIESKRYSDITSNIVDLFDKENLKAEFANNGVRNLISLLGNTIDKAISNEHLKLKGKQLDVRLKELELKEKELELRINSPESFNTPHIVVDLNGGEAYANGSKVIESDSTSLS